MDRADCVSYSWKSKSESTEGEMRFRFIHSTKSDTLYHSALSQSSLDAYSAQVLCAKNSGKIKIDALTFRFFVRIQG